MSNFCEKILTQCIKPDCEKPLFAGVDSEALILNFSQIDKITTDDNNGNIITGITMKTYEVEVPAHDDVPATTDDVPYCGYICKQLGNTPFSGTQVEMTEGTYGNRFTNTVVLAVNDNGPEICHNIIDMLANGKFVVIMKNDYRNSDTDANNKYQVYGAKKGLRASAISREVYGDNESAYIVTLTEENAPMSGMFFYVTSESATDTAYEALKCDCE